MIFSREYVQHLGKQTVRQLIKQGVIVVRQEDENKVIERVSAALLDEMQVEDRINEEVRTILEAIRDEMHRTGAQYPEMFKKMKAKLVLKYKAVL